MGKAPKSVKLQSAHLTKDEKRIRLEVEEKLKNGCEKISPPNRLNANQKKIFNYIVSELEASQILGNLDMFMLETASIAIDRLQSIEKTINQDFSQISNKELMSAKSRYTQDLFKCVTELCLSPSSRARMGFISANKKQEETDPLLQVLKGGMDA